METSSGRPSSIEHTARAPIEPTGLSDRFVLTVGVTSVVLVLLVAGVTASWPAIRLKLALLDAVKCSESCVRISSTQLQYPLLCRTGDRTPPSWREMRDIDVFLGETGFGFCKQGGRRPGMLCVGRPGRTGPFAELLKHGPAGAKLIAGRLPGLAEKPRIALTCLLGEFGPEAVPCLVDRLRDPSEDVRWAAAAGLRSASSAEAVSALAASLGAFTHAGSLRDALISLRDNLRSNPAARACVTEPDFSAALAKLVMAEDREVSKAAAEVLQETRGESLLNSRGPAGSIPSPAMTPG